MKRLKKRDHKRGSGALYELYALSVGVDYQ